MTYKFRLKSKKANSLKRMAKAANFVWNYCNDTSAQYLDKFGVWLSRYELQRLVKGCSNDLPIDSQSIMLIAHQHVDRRKQTKRRKLRWRGVKSLGWIPFRKQSIKLHSDSIVYKGIEFNFWKTREIQGKIKSGSFSQDAQGRWYVQVFCENEITVKSVTGKEIGVDLGLKTIATLSNGQHLNRDNITAKYADKLATAQRAGKKKQAANIHAKIKNTRKDWNHKTTTDLVNRFDRIIVGNVSPSRLKRTKFSKSVSDAGWADFKSMLAYKAIALGVEYKEVKENFSTVTCSVCFERTGPSGLSALGVREWTCKCGATHDRDVNAAKNILRFGHESPIKGAKLYGDAKNEGMTILDSLKVNP